MRGERSRAFIILSGASETPGSAPPPRVDPHQAAHGRFKTGATAIVVTDVIVLCYHAVSPTWEAALSTTPERFARQLALLTARGYRGATFTQAVSSPSHGRVVVVTFDDAYRSVLELARPILDRFGLPATVFAPTDSIGSEAPLCWPGIDHWLGGPHERELTPMSWAQLRTLADAGWEIGSHTGSHPRLTQLDDESLADELARSKAACEQHLGGACTALAYPYGDVDARVVAATARAGYSAAAALPQRLSSGDVLQWPRIGIYQVDDDLRFRLKVSPAVRRLRRSPAWDSLAALGRLRGRLR
jgi:peptidoglycan/xylan/chitin deacetylase (PgdA/CDA1 family)